MATSAERQRLYVSRLSEDQLAEHRRKHAASQQRSYYKKRSRESGTESLEEKKTLKAKSLKPETLRKKRGQTKKALKELQVLEIYKHLLYSYEPTLRRVALAWFRVCRGIDRPYGFFQILMPDNLKTTEYGQPIPRYWRFHKSDLTKNYHPPV